MQLQRKKKGRKKLKKIRSLCKSSGKILCENLEFNACYSRVVKWQNVNMRNEM